MLSDAEVNLFPRLLKTVLGKKKKKKFRTHMLVLFVYRNFIMECIVFHDSLELWYNTVLILLTGNMQNAEVSLDALAIW